MKKTIYLIGRQFGSGGREIGRGTGRTKKAAEQVAAYHGICTVKK